MNGNSTGLPAEIRIKILRYLLRSGELIRSQVDFIATECDTKAEFEFSSLEFSTQILQTCQLLYAEASGILYRESTLVIDLNMLYGHCKSYPPTPVAYYCFLGVQVSARSNLTYAAQSLGLPLPQDLVERKKVTKHVMSRKERPQYRGRQDDFESRTTLDSWIEAYTFLTRFHKFQVFFDLQRAPDEILLFCRRFHAAFLNKDVAMTAVPNMSMPASTMSARLLPCRVLRCQSLRFDLPTEVDVNEIVHTVTSQEPMLDTYGMACLLRRDVFDEFQRIDKKCFLTVHRDLWSELFDKASEYDISAYQDLKESLLEKAQGWNQECLHRRVKKVKEHAAKFQDLITAAMNNELKAIQ